MALTIVTWLWGSKYPRYYVERLANGLRQHLRQPHRFLVVSPEPEDEYLTKVKGCFCRLRMFDPEWQAKYGITDRVVCVDLDVVITGPLDVLFDRSEPFTILQDVNSSNPARFNGSIWMLRAGYRPDVWTDFSLDAAEQVPFYTFPDDQGWFEAKMPDAGAWGAADGVFAYKKRNWPGGDALPNGARLVAFPGWRDPSKFQHLDWVKEHWLN